MTCTVSAQELPDSMFHWVYNTHTDEMSGKVTHSAVIYSPDILDLSTTKEEPVISFATIDKHVYMLIMVSKSFIESTTKQVEIKFDGGPSEFTDCNLSATEGVFSYVNINNAKEIMKRMATAHKFTVRLHFITDGSRVIHFNVEGFKPLDI